MQIGSRTVPRQRRDAPLAFGRHGERGGGGRGQVLRHRALTRKSCENRDAHRLRPGATDLAYCAKPAWLSRVLPGPGIPRETTRRARPSTTTTKLHSKPGIDSTNFRAALHPEDAHPLRKGIRIDRFSMR